VITNYQNGYFWATASDHWEAVLYVARLRHRPRGKVLFNTISRSNLTSLYGDATGSASGAQMLTSTYDLTGNSTGGFAPWRSFSPMRDARRAEQSVRLGRRRGL